MHSGMVRFFNEDTNYRILHKRNIKDKIHKMCLMEHKSIGEVNIIICSAPYLYDMNVEHLDHHYNTDIITFDYCESKQDVTGDLFISIDTVKINAKSYKTTTYRELLRVILHGVLHLIGYNDKTDAEQEEMTLKEDTYLALFD